MTATAATVLLKASGEEKSVSVSDIEYKNSADPAKRECETASQQLSDSVSNDDEDNTTVASGLSIQSIGTTVDNTH